MPTTLDNIHESCFRSYHILERVLEMVKRDDNKNTIFELVEFLKEYPAKHETATVNEEMKNRQDKRQQCALVIDYRTLLSKYISHIKACEGAPYMTYEEFKDNGIDFTDEEIITLRKLADIK